MEEYVRVAVASLGFLILKIMLMMLLMRAGTGSRIRETHRRHLPRRYDIEEAIRVLTV